MKSSIGIKLFCVLSFVLLTLGLTLSAQNKSAHWQPTKVPAGTNFVGRQACAECHSDKNKSQLKNSMGRAMEYVAHSPNLTNHPNLTFRDGVYRYEITRKGAQSFYTVSDGKKTLTVEIAYALGQGKAGQTYLLKSGESFWESRVSFYEDIKGLGITIGAQPLTATANLNDALGRPVSHDEAVQCFGCHSSGAVVGKQLQLEKAEAGIGCEGCHGPGGEHIKASQAGAPSAQKIFNPGKMSADDLTQEFCAACHRSAEDLFVFPQQGGLNNVRFQPYRIFNSKCYSDDRRVSCIACHDVHEPLQTSAAYYDAKCAACHTNKEPQAKLCKVGKTDCASCHMPKIELPGAHFKFTDHRIRIAKKGEPYPF